MNCCVCDRPMVPGGALLFGPPKDKACVVEHICTECWPLLCTWLGNMRVTLRDPPILHLGARQKSKHKGVPSSTCDDPSCWCRHA